MMDLRDLPGYRPDAPGAVLDSQPWAASWAHFLRAISDRADGSARQVIRNAMSERVPSEGGFLVPETLRAQVMAYMTSAIVRPQAMVVPMTAYRMSIPVLDNPDQSSGRQALGGLTFTLAEAGETIPASNPQLAVLALEARKIAAYLQAVPSELTDDAAGAMGDLLARVIAMGHAWYEDDLFISAGSGAGQPESLASAGCAVTVSRGSAGKVLLPDVTALAKALHPAAKQAGMTPGRTHVRWLLSADVLDQFLDLYEAVGTAPTSAAVAPPGWFDFGDGHDKGPNMLGLPASVTDHQPAAGSRGDVILADLSQYVVADRLTMTVERSVHPSFGSDASDFRIRSRVDGRCWVRSATTTEAGTSVSPVVVLQ